MAIVVAILVAIPVAFVAVIVEAIVGTMLAPILAVVVPHGDPRASPSEPFHLLRFLPRASIARVTSNHCASGRRQTVPPTAMRAILSTYLPKSSNSLLIRFNDIWSYYGVTVCGRKK